MQLGCYGLLRKNYALFLVIFVNFDQFRSIACIFERNLWNLNKHQCFESGVRTILEINTNTNTNQERIRIRSPDNKLKKRSKIDRATFRWNSNTFILVVEFKFSIEMRNPCLLPLFVKSHGRPFQMIDDYQWCFGANQNNSTLRLDFYNFGIWKGKKNETRNLFASFWREWCDHCITGKKEVKTSTAAIENGWFYRINKHKSWTHCIVFVSCY